MNKFVCSALAIFGAGVVGNAGETTDQWLGLDQEISNLNTTISADSHGGMGAMIRSSFQMVDEDLLDDVTATDDDQGWSFQDIDLWFSGAAGDYSWRVSMDMSGHGDSFGGGAPTSANTSTNDQGGGADLEDAYAVWSQSNFDVTWGQFKFPTSFSASGDENNMLFTDRTAIGANLDGYDMGIMLSGSTGGGIGWMLGAQNGDDSRGDDMRYSLRAEYGFGEAGGDNVSGTLGLFFNQDDGVADDDNTLMGLDVAASMGAFTADIEFADYDDGIGDATPYSATVGYTLSDDMVAALRYQDMDDANDSTSVGLSLNWDHGNGAKWIFEVQSLDADSGGDDGTIFQIGLCLGGLR